MAVVAEVFAPVCMQHRTRTIEISPTTGGRQCAGEGYEERFCSDINCHCRLDFLVTKLIIRVEITIIVLQEMLETPGSLALQDNQVKMEQMVLLVLITLRLAHKEMPVHQGLMDYPVEMG